MKNALPFSSEITTGWKALSIIRHQLGLTQTAVVLSSMIGAMREGEPFSKLPKPLSRREELVRKQMAPSILLYRALKEITTSTEALSIVRTVIIKSVRALLKRSNQALCGLCKEPSIDDQSKNKRRVTEVDQTFFHAELTWGEISEKRVTFRATGCQYPPLCEKVGVQELALMFCEGSRSFFEQDINVAKLVLPHTIAQGALSCPFSLELNRTPAEAKKIAPSSTVCR